MLRDSMMFSKAMGPEKGTERMKEISEQDKKEIRRAACDAVAYSLIAGQLTMAVGKVGKLFYGSPKPIDWENVFEQVDEMNRCIVTAFKYIKCARKEMQFLTNKQLELEGPRKVEK